MLNQINNAFANLDEKMHTTAIEYAKEKKGLFNKIRPIDNNDITRKTSI